MLFNRRECRQAICLLTHVVDENVLAKIKCLKKNIDINEYRVFILLHNTMPSQHNRMPIAENDVFCCDFRHMREYGYVPISNTMVPGSCHFPIFEFFKTFSSFNYYWKIEYDVEYTGDWAEFFYDCSANLHIYDFLSTHVEKFNSITNGRWPWWTEGNSCGFNKHNCIKAFNPICRLSNKAMKYVDSYLQRGFSAHEEVIITTCLYNAGYKLADFGGTGEFVPKGFYNKYYVRGVGVNSGTMRWRPLFTKEEVCALECHNKLFHPVKW